MHKESEILPPRKREHVERRQQRHPVAGILRRGDESFLPSHSSHTSVSHVTRTHHQRTSSSAHHRSNKNLWSSKIWIGSPSPRSQIALPRTDDIQKRSAGAQVPVSLAGFQLLLVIPAAPHRHKWLVPWCQTMDAISKDEFLYTRLSRIDRSFDHRSKGTTHRSNVENRALLFLSQIGFLNYS